MVLSHVCLPPSTSPLTVSHRHRIAASRRMPAVGVCVNIFRHRFLLEDLYLLLTLKLIEKNVDYNLVNFVV